MVAAFALALSVASTPPTTTRPPVVSAQHLEELTAAGKAEDAIAEGRPAVAAHPNDVYLRLALARALAAKARHVNRLVNVKLSDDDVAKGAVKLQGEDLGAAKAAIAYDEPLFEEAITQLEAAIKLAPQREDLRVFQCFLLTDAGKTDRAEAAIVSTFASLPRTPVLAKTMTAYGAERAKRGDAEGAAKLLAPVARAFPSDPAILVDYANVLTRLGRKTEAYAAFDRAVELAPKEVRFARTKAVGAMLLRDYKRAQTAFDAAFLLSHDVSDEFASFAAAYGVDPTTGATLMRKLAAPAPKSDPQVTDLASAFVRAGKAGASSHDAMALAQSLLTSQRFVFAIPVLDRAAKASPKNTDATAMLKAAYRELGCESLAK